MKIEEVKLFESQPSITKDVLEDLEKRGLLVPEKSLHKGERRETEVANPTAGQVVGYVDLAGKLSAGKVSQDDARRLLAIEAVRPNGRPRQSHIDRLLVAAFAGDKSNVLASIEAVRVEAWAKKAK
tara:strand:+ start:5573 stop:5950 length:378 start_codon:yes stop_codon:yes gene_type:complete